MRPLPTVSLDPRHNYKKDNAFQTCFTGKLTNKAIERYALLGRYGEAEKQRAIRRLGTVKAAKNVKKSIENILANKYITICYSVKIAST